MEKITLADVPETVPAENKRAWVQHVNTLLEKAQPGNSAFYRLENLWGFIGDYRPEDVGMHFSDKEEQHD